MYIYFEGFYNFLQSAEKKNFKFFFKLINNWFKPVMNAFM